MQAENSYAAVQGRSRNSPWCLSPVRAVQHLPSVDWPQAPPREATSSGKLGLSATCEPTVLSARARMLCGPAPTRSKHGGGDGGRGTPMRHNKKIFFKYIHQNSFLLKSLPLLTAPSWLSIVPLPSPDTAGRVLSGPSAPLSLSHPGSLVGREESALRSVVGGWVLH